MSYNNRKVIKLNKNSKLWSSFKNIFPSQTLHFESCWVHSIRLNSSTPTCCILLLWKGWADSSKPYTLSEGMMLLEEIMVWWYNYVAVYIAYIFTWNTGPRLGFSVHWCEKASGGGALHSTQKRAQVTYWHLLDERGPIFAEIPPLKYLRWGRKNMYINMQKACNTTINYPFAGTTNWS